MNPDSGISSGYVLEAKGLSKIYAQGRHPVHALKSISLSVNAGEFVAVMGPSGSGKSTLLHLLGGLDQPTEGEIFLSGHPVTKLRDQEATLVRRRYIGFVFQFFNLLPTLTAEENILLPLLIDGQKPKNQGQKLEQILQRMGLGDRRHHKPDALSGGEQQRVALARALMTSPAILLADEPTGNLDTKTGKEVMELLQASAKEFQQAIIMVTHDPKAAAYAHRIIFLQDGQLIRELCFSEEQDYSSRHRQIMVQLEEGEGT